MNDKYNGKNNFQPKPNGLNTFDGFAQIESQIPLDIKIINRLKQKYYTSVYLIEYKDEKAVLKHFCPRNKEESSIFEKLPFQEILWKLPELNHVNLMKVFEVGENYIISEYCGEKTIEDYAKNNYFEKALFFLKEGMNALIYLGDKDFCHKDVKQTNFMIAKNDVTKLIDFELLSSSKYRFPQGWIIGSVSHMAPEQMNNEIAITNDIYSCGASIYEIITGNEASAVRLNDIDKATLTNDDKFWRWFDFTQNNKDFNDWSFDNPRLKIDDTIKNLTIRMLSFRPEKRPSMKECQEELSAWVENNFKK